MTFTNLVFNLANLSAYELSVSPVQQSQQINEEDSREVKLPGLSLVAVTYQSQFQYDR